MRAAILAAAILAAAAPALAQPHGPVDRREQVKKKIRAMRAYTLTEALELDEQTAGKLFPMLARYDDELDKLVGARVDAHKRLVEAGGLTDARAVDHAIDDALANEKAMRAVEDRRVGEFRKILTPQQVAKILIVLPAIDRKIQNQLARVVRQQAAAGGGAAAGRKHPRPVDLEDDDDADDDAPMSHDAPAPAVAPHAGTKPAVPADKAALEVSCQCAANAHVLVDGADIGVSPAHVVTAPGAHRITFVIDGSRYTYNVGAVAGQVTTLHKDLR